MFRLLLLCAFIILPQISHAEPVSTVIKVTETELVIVEGYETPPDALTWQVQRLPDVWFRNHPGEHRDGWYRTIIHLDQVPEKLWAIYLPRIRMNVAVFVNGTLVGSGGSFAEPMARNWNRPLYYSLPSDLLKQGENTIHLRLGSYPANRSAVHPFYLGEDSELRPEYESRYFWQIDILKTLCVVAAFLGLFTLFIWYRDRQSGMYGWYAVGSLSWAIYIPYFFVSDIPVGSHYWIWLCFNGCFWMIAGMMLFICHFINHQRPWFFRTVLAYSLIATVATLFSEPAAIMDNISRFFIGYVVIVLVTSFWLIRFVWSNRSFKSWFILASVLTNVAFGINDLLILIYGISPPYYLLHYGAPVMIFSMGIILVEHFVRTMRFSRNMNLVLDEKLKLREGQLDESYQRLHEMEKTKAVQEERERITRDIHDGLGGHLVSALALAEKYDLKGGLHQVIRESLDELRAIIDTTSEEEGLDVLLSVMRFRYKTHCAEHGLEIDWHVDDAVEYLTINNFTAIHLTRILQESMTNVFKHANATEVSVQITVQFLTDATTLQMKVCDNGAGLPDQQRDGHGLPSIRKRAADIGATIEMTNQAEGGFCTCLDLKMDLDGEPQKQRV